MVEGGEAQNTAMAAPIRTSNKASGAGTGEPGGPAGKEEVTVMAKSLASTSTTTAWAA